MAALDRIARMKRELELAELARLAARRQHLLDEANQVRQQAMAALRAGAGSAIDGRAADNFGRWAAARQAILAKEAYQVDSAVTVQKGRAALAVGRQDVLERILGRLKETTLRARAKK